MLRTGHGSGFMPARRFRHSVANHRAILPEVSSFPTVTGLLEVVSCDVAPRDERDENDDHEAGLDILSSGGGDLVSGPQGQSERKKVNRLPDKLEEQQWEHLHGIA